MRLTNFSNYSMRVLMVAAARSPLLTTIPQVADQFDISKAHLVKCVHQLGRRGYLETVRGNGGGFRLARPAAAITIGEIIRKTEEEFSLVECFDRRTNRCPLVGRCRLRGALARATEAFLNTLVALTLAEVTDNADVLLSVLDLSAPECTVEKDVRPDA